MKQIFLQYFIVILTETDRNEILEALPPDCNDNDDNEYTYDCSNTNGNSNIH